MKLDFELNNSKNAIFLYRCQRNIAKKNILAPLNLRIFQLYFFILICISIASCNFSNEQIHVVDFSNQDTNSGTAKENNKKLAFAISAMISPSETFKQYEELIKYISNKLDIEIEIKLRKTYKEVNDLLISEEVDFAFICTGAYIDLKKDYPIEILAVPVINNEPYYQAYIITAANSGINTFEQLKAKSFAFTDPLSNTGCNYIIRKLKKADTKPERFFSKVIYTNAHDFSIQAVARNFIDGATIDGLIYDYLAKTDSSKISNIRIVQKSEKFAIPPFIIRSNIDDKLKGQVQDIFFNMHMDSAGRNIMSKLLIDKFIDGDTLKYEY